MIGTKLIILAYHELDFTMEDRNTIYWHHTVAKYSKIKPNNILHKFIPGLGLMEQFVIPATLIF